jgi:hypothetical protein
MKYTTTIDGTKVTANYKRGKLQLVEAETPPLNLLKVAEKVPTLEKDVDTSLMVQQAQAKAKNLFTTPAMQAWNRFYEKKAGLPYRFTAADGGALANIGKYLADVCNGSTDEALGLWDYIIANWEQLPDFYRTKPDLKFVNSQLNKIVYQLRNGKPTTAAGTATQRNDADDLRSRITR